MKRATMLESELVYTTRLLMVVVMSVFSVNSNVVRAHCVGVEE
jgi:hypothetical protein